MARFMRRPTVDELVERGDVTALRDALADALRGRGDRRDAVRRIGEALADLGDVGARALVEAVLAAPHPDLPDLLGEQVCTRLAGAPAVAVLSAALLGSSDREVRFVAVRMLAGMGTSLAHEAFAQAITDPDLRIRVWAAKGLADLGDARGVDVLVKVATRGEDPGLVVPALGKAGDSRVIPALRQLRESTVDPVVVDLVDHAVSAIGERQQRRPGPEERLVGICERLRSIEVVDRTAAAAAGAGVEQARDQIPIICDNIDHALRALRTGASADGRPTSPAQVGAGLSALAADVTGPGFDGMMSSVVGPRGVRAVQREVRELDRIAWELREGSGPRAQPGGTGGESGGRLRAWAHGRDVCAAAGDPTIEV